MALKLVSVSKSDKGKVRSSNQDSGYSGVNLFVVADGMGGHAGGDIASAIATQHVAKVDDVYQDGELAIGALLNAMREANVKLTETVSRFGYLAGMGTTMDAVLITGHLANIAHIGDSRVYLLRDNTMTQITKDHTFVQKLVDSGKITEEEALYHPRRNVLMRVLGDASEEPEFDIHQIEIRDGDRLLLCSDGLCSYVPAPIIEENMRVANLDEAIDLLIDEAKEYGAPDNVTVLILEARETTEQNEASVGITWLGSAANEVVIKSNSAGRILEIFSPVRWLEAFRDSASKEAFFSEKDPALAKAIDEFGGKVRNWKLRGLALFVILGLVSGASLWGVYAYTQTRYYLGVEDGKVAIYQGIKESFAGFGFSKLYEKSSLDLTSLPDFQQELLVRSISADSLSDAKAKLEQIIESTNNG
ncbi:MAG: serine/threonine-protein phosphatase [Micrococcales bacterium]|jgi:protein phosphatase|nr:serine/threonine-protein phosphatase [Actinomycetota bacterium]NCA07677.1 serine/threonine-protein phosphatase [Micrococcales bacterium]